MRHTHTKKEKRYQDNLMSKINRRLDNKQNSSFDAAVRHVFMQEMLRMQKEIDQLKEHINAQSN